MKKILIVAAAAGLMSLAACTSNTENTEVANVEAPVENVEAPVDANLVSENVVAPVENVTGN